MKDVVTWVVIEVYFIQLQDWRGELLKAIREPGKTGRGKRWSEILLPAAGTTSANPHVARDAP